MSFASELACLAAECPPRSLDALQRDLPPEWIAAALAATGTATVRRRRLPAEQVVWLVIGMALYRDRSIVEVAASLDLALPGSRGPTAAPSAISRARSRLGAEPLAWLFEETAQHWAESSASAQCWRGLSLWGVDGTSLRVPDSPENRAHFGGHSAGPRGESAYPLVRLCALFALRSHLVHSAAFGPFKTDERRLAASLWPKIPDHSLTILDRHLLSAAALFAVHGEGEERHWLLRLRRDVRLQVVKELGACEALVECVTSARARRHNPRLPRRWRARAIVYRMGHAAPQVLLTSLRDAAAYPAAELIRLYHERWEMELAFDELKTELLEREEAIRSTRPERVTRELWGLLLGYNLVRLEMERAAAEADLEPTRISFVAALHLIRDEWLRASVAAPGTLPLHLRRLRQRLTLLVLPPRRLRRYPRVVKLKLTSRFPRKRPNHTAESPK